MKKIAIINNHRSLNYRQTVAFESFVAGYSPATTMFLHAGQEADMPLHNILFNKEYKIEVYVTKDQNWNKDEEDVRVLVFPQKAFRNKSMVDDADVVIAFPLMIFEYEDSPSWKTILYSISLGKETVVYSPRGHIYQVRSPQDFVSRKDEDEDGLRINQI